MSYDEILLSAQDFTPLSAPQSEERGVLQKLQSRVISKGEGRKYMSARGCIHLDSAGSQQSLAQPVPGPSLSRIPRLLGWTVRSVRAKCAGEVCGRSVRAKCAGKVLHVHELSYYDDASESLGGVELSPTQRNR